jgi:uncharacterized cofD-like protein
MNKRPQLVVIGGGTGTYVTLSGLQNYPIDLSAIVAVADSGGSTGRLRDEFGFAPVGDLRQALAALALKDTKNHLTDLLLYRFTKGEGLEGHNLGNLILTALQDITGGTAPAVETAGKIFRLKGHIYPSTTQKVDLVVEYQDGTFIIGEHHLNPSNSGGKKIKRIRLSPKAALYQKAKIAIESADSIIIGPGDLYASLMPNLIVSGIKTAFNRSKANLIYIVNLMTSFTQTHGMTARQHVQTIESALGRPIDQVIINNQPIPKKHLAHYATQHEFPLQDDLGQDPRATRLPLITTASVSRQPGDTVTRSYLRHDSHALAKYLYNDVVSKSK